MERAPIPPHERPWRHPSELGPVDAELGGSGRHRAVLLAGGTLAVVMVAALVVAMTPARGTSPLAVSATTAPTAGSEEAVIDDVGRTVRIDAVKAIPKAIVAVPGTHALTNDSPGGAAATSAVLPDLDDDVLVLTDSVAYALPWRDVAWLGVEEAIVVAADGSIVARFEAGRFIVTADAVVGAALSVAED